MNDWNTGKIKYCTQPPEDNSTVHISASIVSSDAKEFELDALDAMETDVMENFPVSFDNIVEYKPTEVDVSSLKTQIIEPMKEDTNDDEPQAKRGRRAPAEELEGKFAVSFDGEKTKSLNVNELFHAGNQQLNKSIKEQQKKNKKRKLKAEKKVDKVADVLENFNFGKSDEAYDFDNDFVM